VVDVAASLFTKGAGFSAILQGNAIRVISGGVFSGGGNIFLAPGTNAAAVSDPFYDNAGNYVPGMGATSLGYTLSLFPGTTVQGAAGTTLDALNLNGSTGFADSAGMNLNGTLSATTINVIANNINSNNGTSGGFVVPDKGTLNLQFFGNVNNPGGAAAHGSTSFFYNYVPVTVGANGTKAGTATITVTRPSQSSSPLIDQNVNLLIQGPGSLAGNVNLQDGSGSIAGFTTAPLTAPGPFPTAPVTPYANHHLVVTATGNIGFNPSLAPQPNVPPTIGTNSFYWPGLVYLTSGATASNPTAAPNSTATISLGTTSANPTVSFFNILAADLTKPDVGGQTGGGQVHFLTNNLVLSPGTGAGGTVTISNDSWANFLNSTLSQSFATTAGTQFFGGSINSSGQVAVVKLSAADFKP
jgi:hypothetical protein